MERSPLEEAELMNPALPDLVVKQAPRSLKRVAIDASLLAHLPFLPLLEELAVVNMDRAAVALLQRFSQVSRLTLSGEHDPLSEVDTSSFTGLKNLVISITSPPRLTETLERDSSFPRALSSSAGVELNLFPNDTWTNTTLNDAVCGYPASQITQIQMTCDPASVRWFRLPSCISTWTAITYIATTSCQMSNFSVFPASLTSINIQNAYGTWSQTDAGTLVDASTAHFFDWSWLPNLTSLASVLIFSSQDFNATLPNHISHPTLKTMLLYIPANALFKARLVGTISPSWFVQYPSMTIFGATNHNLTGTIPYYGLQKLTTLTLTGNQFTHWPSIVSNSSSGFGVPSGLINIALNNNNLVQIPSESDFQAMNVVFFTIGQNPSLSTTFPNIFATPTVRTAATVVQSIAAAGCAFYGSLPSIPAYQTSLYSDATTVLSVDLSRNAMSGPIPATWATMKIPSLNLSSNAGLSGTLAEIDSNGLVVSQFLRDSGILDLSGTAFTGPMFNISNMPSLRSLTLGTANVDFCSANRSGLSYASQASIIICSLGGNASACAQSYPSLCTFIASPSPSPTPTSVSCPLPNPGTSFTCEAGVWVSTGSVTQGSITVPGSSTTVVLGNLSTTSIVVNSISSTINVTGCIINLNGTTPSITITLTESDLQKLIKAGGTLTTQLLQQASSCNAISASSVNIDTSAIKSCKKIKTSKISSSSGFAATFTLSTSGCNTWWIILVSVVCGLILIGIIVVAVLSVAWPAFRTKLRPFSGRRKGQRNIA